MKRSFDMHRTRLARPFALAAALGLALPAVAADTVLMPSLDGNLARVLVKRGDAYLPIDGQLALQATDSLVVLEGGNVNLLCGEQLLTSFTETGVYSIPPCPARVAAAPASPAGSSAGAAAPDAASGTVGYGSPMNAAAIATAAAFAAGVVIDDNDDNDQSDLDKPASP
jgi:hypothetical protein